MRSFHRIAAVLQTTIALSSAAPDPLLAAALPARQSTSSTKAAVSPSWETLAPDHEFITYLGRAERLSKILGLESSRACSRAMTNLLSDKPIYISPNQIADVFWSWDHANLVERPFINRGIRSFLSEKNLLALRADIVATLEKDREAMQRLEKSWELLEISYMDADGKWLLGPEIIPGTRPQFAQARMGAWEIRMMESNGLLMVSLRLPDAYGDRGYPPSYAFNGWSESSLRAAALTAARERSGYADDSEILFAGERALLAKLAFNLEDPDWRERLRILVRSIHSSEEIDSTKTGKLLWGR